MCTTWYSTPRSPSVTRMWSSTCETPLNTYVYCSATGSVAMRSVRIDGAAPFARPVRSTESAGAELVVVEVAEDDDVRLAVDRQRRRHEVVDRARLPGALP